VLLGFASSEPVTCDLVIVAFVPTDRESAKSWSARGELSALTAE
jgi:hypothetical protein